MLAELAMSRLTFCLDFELEETTLRHILYHLCVCINFWHELANRVILEWTDVLVTRARYELVCRMSNTFNVAPQFQLWQYFSTADSPSDCNHGIVNYVTTLRFQLGEGQFRSWKSTYTNKQSFTYQIFVNFILKQQERMEKWNLSEKLKSHSASHSVSETPPKRCKRRGNGCNGTFLHSSRNAAQLLPTNSRVYLYGNASLVSECRINFGSFHHCLQYCKTEGNSYIIITEGLFDHH